MSAVFADTSFYLAYVNPRDGAAVFLWHGVGLVLF